MTNSTASEDQFCEHSDDRKNASQAEFEASVDKHDNPSGATVQDDNFSGS